MADSMLPDFRRVLTLETNVRRKGSWADGENRIDQYSKLPNFPASGGQLLVSGDKQIQNRAGPANQGSTTNSYGNTINLPTSGGNINFRDQNIYLRQKTPPPEDIPPLDNFPHFLTPLTIGTEYIGESHIGMLTTLKSRLDSHSSRRVVIYGPIGIGKSQIACQIKDILLKDRSVKHTFWISSATTSGIETAFREIANMIEPGRQMSPQGSTLRTVKNWLEKPSNGPWLIVFDDFMNITVPKNAEGVSLPVAHLPHTLDHGYLIITTPNRNTAFSLAHPHDPGVLCFKVPELESDEAYGLLRQRTRPVGMFDLHRESAEKLVKKLDHNPSAILLAAAFISKRHELGENVSSYLESFKEVPLDDVLTSHSDERLQGLGLSRSPIFGWEKTLEDIHSLETIDLFALMSCFERSNIRTSLLNLWEPRRNILRNHLEVLNDNMLITSCSAPESYSIIQSLVQLTAHKWLYHQGTRQKWQCKALGLLYKQYQEYENIYGVSIQAYTQQRQLLTHVDIFVHWYTTSNDPVLPETLTELAPSFVSFAILYASEGRYNTAKRLLFPVCKHEVKCDAIWKILASKTRAEIIRSENYWKPILDKNRKKELKLARNILNHALKLAQNTRDKDAEFDIEASLALNYSDDQEFILAEECQNKVVSYRSQQANAYPGAMPEDIEARLGLSKIFYRRGRSRKQRKRPKYEDCFSRARVLQEKLVQELKAEAQIEDDNARICEVQAALARTIYEQDQFQTAVIVGKQAYDERTRLFGSYDLKTLGVASDLAASICKNGDPEEALKLLAKTRERLVVMVGHGSREVWKCDERIAWAKGYTDRNEVEIGELRK